MNRILIIVTVVCLGMALPLRADGLSGLFGRLLGEEVKGGEERVDGDRYERVVVFVPKTNFLEFDSYTLHMTPKSHKVFAIRATKTYDDDKCKNAREESTKLFAKAATIMLKKFGKAWNGYYNAIDPIEGTRHDEEMWGRATMSFGDGRAINMSIHAVNKYSNTPCTHLYFAPVIISAEDAELKRICGTESQERKEEISLLKAMREKVRKDRKDKKAINAL